MVGTAPATQATLQGLRVLVVEDEYMIAEEVAGELSDAGAQALGPVPRVGDAMCLIAAENRIDGALLDVKLGNEAIWPVVDMLLKRGVPLVLATGYDASAIPRAYAHLPRCENRRADGTSPARSPGCLRPSAPTQADSTRTTLPASRQADAALLGRFGSVSWYGSPPPPPDQRDGILDEPIRLLGRSGRGRCAGKRWAGRRSCRPWLPPI